MTRLLFVVLILAGCAQPRANTAMRATLPTLHGDPPKPAPSEYRFGDAYWCECPPGTPLF